MNVILGCGDVGRRIVKTLLSQNTALDSIHAYVNSQASIALCERLGLTACSLDLDKDCSAIGFEPCQSSHVFYTIAPQKEGELDLRSQALLESWERKSIVPRKVVLISTTGVYGDCKGEWVTERSANRPQTARGKRRLHSETIWQEWADKNNVPLVVLRVPGIYAYSRLPVERIKKGIPVVRADECGFTNRIHADDLARICVVAMQKQVRGTFNATDGAPGKISEYLQEAARALDLPALPEIAMREAQAILSPGMLSYLNESRKISNEALLAALDLTLLYPDFRVGIKHG